MNPQSLFDPKSIAVIGASRDEKSVGYGILKNLAQGCVMQCNYCMPFGGKVFPVNPNATSLLGLRSFPSLKEIQEKVDLAIIALPAAIVERAVDQCIQKKVKAVIIISAGFSEIGKKGALLQQRIARKLMKSGICLLGPNCLGIVRTSNHLNASFAPSMPPRGSVAFISQSGGLADSVIDWSIGQRYGFSSIVSVGNAAGMDLCDFIEYFGNDKETKVITLYIEGLISGKKFMDTASRVSKKKPIIVIKAGKTEKGTKAVSSHTGSLAGDYEVYKAAFGQCGVMIAESVEEMFDVAKALSTQPIPKKNAIAIITNGGGPGVLCADYCTEFGVDLVTLDQDTVRELLETGKMNPWFSQSNPLDIVGDALSERYDAAITTLLSKQYISGLIIIQTLQTMTDPVGNAKVIVNAHRRFPHKPIVCTYVGGHFVKDGIRYLEDHGVPDYNDVRKSAKVMSALVNRIRGGN